MGGIFYRPAEKGLKLEDDTPGETLNLVTSPSDRVNVISSPLEHYKVKII